MTTLDQLMGRGVFPVTFHNYSPFGAPAGRPEAVKDWLDLGITIGRTPVYRPEIDRKQDVLSILDACAEAGLMCFVNDARGSMGRMFECANEDEYRRGFERALKDFGDHPAAFGFDVGDEPAHDRITKAFRTYAIQREMAPQLTPFMSCAGYTPGGTEWMGLRSYRRYIDELVDVADPTHLWHGSYYLCADVPGALENHFLTYKMYTDAMLRHRLPTWITMLCTGHFNMWCPSADELRWQIGIAATLGHKGFAWFNVYTYRSEENYRFPPINEFGERTQTFEWLSYELRRFHKTVAPTLLELDYQRACHIGGPRLGGFPNTVDSELVKSVEVRESKFPVLVSELKDPEGRDYVAVLNNSREGYGQARIIWHGNPKVHKVVWEGAEEEPRRWVNDADPEDRTAVTAPWLAPGQMELYRVESDARERL